MPPNEINAEELYGCWRLVEATAVNAKGEPEISPWGPLPMGRLVLDRSGRMMAVLCDGRSSLPAGTKRAYSSYCGNFSVENDVLTTIVDAASDPSRIGSHQRRRLEFRSGRLVLLPPVSGGGQQRELYWELETAYPKA